MKAAAYDHRLLGLQLAGCQSFANHLHEVTLAVDCPFGRFRFAIGGQPRCTAERRHLTAIGFDILAERVLEQACPSIRPTT